MTFEEIRKYKYWKYPVGNLEYNIWEFYIQSNAIIEMKSLGWEGILRTRIDPYRSTHFVDIHTLNSTFWTPVKDI